MFDKIGDLPLHPLALHVPVIVIPLTLLLAMLFAFPRTRAWSRWALGITAVGTALSTWVTKESGEALYEQLGITGGNPVGDLINQHSELADQLFVITLVFAALAVANVLLVPARQASDGAVTERLAPPLRIGLLALLLAAGVLAVIWTYRVGDLGARAVWNPTGTGL